MNASISSGATAKNEDTSPAWEALHHTTSTVKNYQTESVNQVIPIDNEVPKPILAREALYGIAGDIVQKIEPETEAHPASLHLQLLAALGSIIGRGPHFMTGKDSHHTNLFVAIVGATARGRKGTAYGWVLSILKQVDPAWSTCCIKTGLQSGEGIIHALADGNDGEQKDKRLLVVEEELAQALQAGSRNGSTLSPTLRCAWSRGDLNNLSKGAAETASNCHLSLIGHITREELGTLLSKNDVSNGFANRFLMVHTSRTRILPESKIDLDFTSEVTQLKEAIIIARNLGVIQRTPKASEYWHSIYPELTREDIPGLWGKATSRAEAQVVRLSLLFCLLDIHPIAKPHHIQIDVHHLEAAKALWDYCFHSARWALEEFRLSKVAQTIYEELTSGPKDRSYIISNVFKRHITKSQLDASLKELADHITVEEVATAGRTRTIYSLKQSPAT